MLRLHRWIQRHRRLVLAGWAIAFLLSLPLARRQSDRLTAGGFADRGASSQRVESAVERSFSDARPPNLAAVLLPRAGAGPADLRRARRAVRRAVATAPGVELSPAASRRGRRAPRLLVPLDAPAGEQAAIEAARQLRERLAATPPADRVRILLAGQGALWDAFHSTAEGDIRVAESRAFPLVALVLLATFGSLAAMALPLAIGVASVAITGASIYLLSLETEVSLYATNMASMLGIGVAVDYSLFVLARYREEIAAGHAPARARDTAMATSGATVAFSGMTVIASLAGLFAFDSTALQSMAVGAILVVAISVLAATSLLPALLHLFGSRVDRPSAWRGRIGSAPRRRPRGSGRFWERWTALVTRRPLASALAATLLLLTMAIPALDLAMGNDARSQLGPGDPARRGSEAAARITGPGALGPVYVLAELERGPRASAPALRRLRAALASEPGVARVSAPLLASRPRQALIDVTLAMDPESGQARALVDRLRRRLPPREAGLGRVLVGGTTAVIHDFDTSVSTSLWKLFAIVLATSFLALLLLLRSVVLPFKAALANLLSVAAAYGVLVAVFQWGWLSWLGLEPAPFVDTITPPLVLAIAFGLSMDYEVFLLSRIRERYLVLGDTRRAVAEGLASSAATITSATVIMVGVFLAFVSAGLPAVQRIGLTVAVAIAIDATVVRLVLVPATMVLLNRWNWWLPPALERRLPGTRAGSPPGSPRCRYSSGT